jgi:ribonuclease-3
VVRSQQPLSDTERFALAEKVLGHSFADRDLLRRALTHPSTVDQGDPLDSYERLEFLGDAVLAFAVADATYRRFPSAREGEMTRIKASAVSGRSLTAIAKELGLERAIAIGHRETSARGINSALENTFEALLGALYLDAGIETAMEFARRTLDPRLSADASVHEHPKSALMELAAASGRPVSFDIVEIEGPAHERTFTSQVSVDGEVLGSGRGASKKEAETAAAVEALAAMRGKGRKQPRQRR